MLSGSNVTGRIDEISDGVVSAPSLIKLPNQCRLQCWPLPCGSILVSTLWFYFGIYFFKEYNMNVLQFLFIYIHGHNPINFLIWTFWPKCSTESTNESFSFFLISISGIMILFIGNFKTKHYSAININWIINDIILVLN